MGAAPGEAGEYRLQQTLPPLVHRWVGQTIVAAANTLVGVGEERGDTGSPSRGAFVDLLLGEMRIAPLDGDVYVLWSPARKEFVRSGIIVAIEHMEKVSDGSMGYRCVTIDGDSDAITAAVGTKVLRSAACAERGGRRSVYSMDGDGWP